MQFDSNIPISVPPSLIIISHLLPDWISELCPYPGDSIGGIISLPPRSWDLDSIPLLIKLYKITRPNGTFVVCDIPLCMSKVLDRVSLRIDCPIDWGLRLTKKRRLAVIFKGGLVKTRQSVINIFHVKFQSLMDVPLLWRLANGRVTTAIWPNYKLGCICFVSSALAVYV